MNDELTITIRISRFLKYILGDLEKVSIEMEEARVLDLLKYPSIYIQFYELDAPNEGKPLEKPILWQYKYWHVDLLRRRRFKEKKEIERLACNKQSENIQRISKYMQIKFKLPENLSRYAAEQMIVHRDTSMIKSLGIHIDDLNDTEWRSAYEYNEMLKQRSMKNK